MARCTNIMMVLSRYMKRKAPTKIPSLGTTLHNMSASAKADLLKIREDELTTHGNELLNELNLWTSSIFALLSAVIPLQFICLCYIVSMKFNGYTISSYNPIFHTEVVYMLTSNELFKLMFWLRFMYEELKNLKP